ncbi:MAG: DUF4292 domain-containing protein [Mucilaginibacter sp.]
MRENMLNRLLVICCLLAMVSCKARKLAVVASGDNKVPIKTLIGKLDSIRQNQLNFNTFSGKARTKLTIGTSSNDVTLNIRINKGHKIWVSITAIAGIEVARALITPDSILVLNKLQGLYLKKPFDYIYRYASRQMDYKALEAILVGNAMPQLLNNDAKLMADSTGVSLSGTLEELAYKLLVGYNLKVSQVYLLNQAEGQFLLVNNTAFILAGNKVLPSQINISSAVGTKKMEINLHYIKADFDLPLEYPFSIPSSYDEAK